MKASLGIEAIGYENWRHAQALRTALRESPQNATRLREATRGLRRGCHRPAPGNGISPPWWVRRIMGAAYHCGWRYQDVTATVDYADANSAGTRGVMLYYILESGHVYHVQYTPSWGRTAQYFCRVTHEGEIEQISREEVLRCLQNPNGR